MTEAEDTPKALEFALESDDPWIGKVLGDRYKVIEQIGQGGMGTVYVAEHLTLHKQVALKLVHAEGGNEAQAQRFVREAMVTSLIDHPNVISAIDFGEFEDGTAYLAMQLVRGPTLGQVLKETGCMRWARAADIGAQIADALCAAQIQGIVHRDLKPENVILQPLPDGSELVKLLDFGIAKHARDSLAPPPMQKTQAVTRVGIVVGTLGYMAPEQAVGKRADHRSDLYSLGVMLWECVVGERLWGEEDVQALLAEQLNRPPASARVASGDHSIPDELDRLIARLLETNPAERPQSPAEVRDTLRALCADVRRGKLRSDEPSLVRRAPRLIASKAETRIERGGRERKELVDTAPQNNAPPTVVSAPVVVAPVTPALPPVALPRPLVVPPPAAGAVPPSPPRSVPQRSSLWPRSPRSTWTMVAVTIGIVTATWLLRGALVPTPKAPPPKAAPQASAPAAVGAEMREDVRNMLKSLVEGVTREERVAAAEAILKHVPVDEIPAYGRAMAHLQLAETCAQKKEQLDKIALVNDPRTLPVLITLSERKRTGCGHKDREDCLACLRDDLDALIHRLETLQLTPR